MNTIASFQVDHTRLKKGIYVSRVDGDVVTYDIRMVAPNTPPYLSNAGMHTLEHLFAAYVRNGRRGGEIVYVGPMGCRTGFYLLTRDTLSEADAIALVRETFGFIAGYDGDVPGAAERECGNYREHSLPEAKAYAADMAEVLNGYSAERLRY
jgi:S-ribosylhomocysteine lyase